MARSKQSKGIEIVKQQPTPGISIVSGGINIDASGKAMATQFEINWGRVYILLDCSTSMTGNKLEQAKKGIIEFAKDAILKEYLTGLIKFDSSAKHICEPVTDVGYLQGHMKGIAASGSTNMVDAIKMAHERLKDIDCSRVIVIATDGQPDDVNKTIKVGDLAKDDGIEIITIGTDDADQKFLKRLASRNDLGTKVSKEMFAITISSAYKLLPSPKSVIPKR